MLTQDDMPLAYTRQKAIEEGVLWDISEQAKRFGFHYSIATTKAVHIECAIRNPSDGHQLYDMIQFNTDRLLKTFCQCYQEHVKKCNGEVISFPYEMLAKSVLCDSFVGSQLKAKEVAIRIVLNIELDGSRSATLMLRHENQAKLLGMSRVVSLCC